MELVEMTNPIGNEQNMAQVRALMNKEETTEEVNLGDKATKGVPIDFVSAESGKRYAGFVEFKRPNMMEFMQMGARKADFLRKAGVTDLKLVDNLIKYMAQVMATLQTVIVKSPEWLLNLEEIKDADVLFHVHDEYEKWENNFRPKPEDTQEGDSEGTEGA